MWVFLKDSYLSIVEPSRPDLEDCLLVRARAAEDIPNVFGAGYPVIQTADADYHFRALVPRAVVATALSDAVMDVDYSNFKAQVKDKDRHDTYLRVWAAMDDFQDRRLTKRQRRARQRNRRVWSSSAYNGHSPLDRREDDAYLGWPLVARRPATK